MYRFSTFVDLEIRLKLGVDQVCQNCLREEADSIRLSEHFSGPQRDVKGLPIFVRARGLHVGQDCLQSIIRQGLESAGWGQGCEVATSFSRRVECLNLARSYIRNPHWKPAVLFKHVLRASDWLGHYGKSAGVTVTLHSWIVGEKTKSLSFFQSLKKASTMSFV